MNFLSRDVFREEVSDLPITEPFLKWAGGKRWLFRRHRELFPAHVERLIDPFVGGGSSFFYLQPREAILADLNSDLIALYAAVRNHPRKLTRLLVRYHHSHCKDFFYETRSVKPSDPLRKAAWLLYLNRTCWNGLFRVNLKGDFNVPIGTKSKVFFGVTELDTPAKLLQQATLIQSDFESVIDCAQTGDVIFADPPYFESETAGRFLKYNSNVFSWTDQIRLHAALVRARSRGARCFVTNANHRSLVELYRGYLYFTSAPEVVSQGDFARLFAKVHLGDNDFTPERFLPGSSGATKLYKLLLEETGVEP